MNHKRLSLTLAACTLWAGTYLALGDQDSTPVPLVYVGKSSVSALPGSKDTSRGRRPNCSRGASNSNPRNLAAKKTLERRNPRSEYSLKSADFGV